MADNDHACFQVDGKGRSVGFYFAGAEGKFGWDVFDITLFVFFIKLVKNIVQ